MSNQAFPNNTKPEGKTSNDALKLLAEALQ